MANKSGEYKSMPMKLVVQDGKAIIRDFKLNLKAILIALLFFCIYVLLSSLLITCVEKSSSYWNWLYFTFINTATGNIGDIQLTLFGKILTCINAVIGLISFGILAVLITLAFQPDNDSNRPQNLPGNSGPETIKFDQIFDILEGLARRLPHSIERDPRHGYRNNSNGINIDIFKHGDGEVHLNIHFRMNDE